MSSLSPFRLHAATAIGSVRLDVADLARSIDYYTRIVGFKTLSHGDGSATLGSADSIPLLHLHEHVGAAPMPQKGRLGLYHFAILLPDRASFARFLVHLVDIDERAGSADHLVSEALYLHDPDGLGIEVYADHPRSSWQYVEGEIAMDTRPLNVADLMKEAGVEKWRGLPAGTSIGHIHLHVGDIERARAFYDKGLGFDAVVWSYPGALFLSAGGYHHHLGVNTWAGGNAELPREGHARLAEWELVLPGAEDMRDVVRSLESSGISARADGDTWTVADPWGTTLRLTAH